MRAPLLLVFLFLSGQAIAAPSLSGIWFGYGQPGDKGAMYLDRMMPDGAFSVHHRTCVKGKAFDQFASGRWEQSASGFTIHIQTVNGESNPRSDVYRTVLLDAQKIHYVFVPNNFTYNARRVGAKFKMPPCDLIS